MRFIIEIIWFQIRQKLIRVLNFIKKVANILDKYFIYNLVSWRYGGMKSKGVRSSR
ncbi:hypothetical protein NMY3_02789 [Candidatus Nitrosocosmicus oleophilus]|uniref:Uncharacterized protein n=1 Tax=Candidatus Nitrosocosmicus oleophilus TaxID=1353260 RepID=A0A654M3G7_9ARCH|nr:hypothetical protein NMY3_02789 [Candidatus Nitrosocosmicus oleophilus]